MSITKKDQDPSEAHFRIKIDGLGDSDLHVVELSGTETLSGLFHFILQVESAVEIPGTGSKSAEKIVGSKATVSIWAGGFERTIDGIVSSFQFRSVEHGQQNYFYEVEIVPNLCLLGFKQQSRMFQEKSVNDILAEVLKSGGLEQSSYTFSIEKYDPIEYCVQYRETDFHFLNRLAEQFGIFYFFDPTGQETVLTFGDKSSDHIELPEGGALVFDPSLGAHLNPDKIEEFRLSRTIRPTKHTLRDFNFTSPGLDLTKSHDSEVSGELEWYDYPGQYVTGSVGTHFAQVRQEAEECARINGMAKTACTRVFPGAYFALKEHPFSSLNGKYLITGVTHMGHQSLRASATGGETGYSNQISIQPFDIPYRAPLKSRKPVVEGSQTAIVTGGSGDEICTDEFGRVKVRFHWDRSDSADDKSSCWMRVSQVWGGKGWGGMMIPRVGQEVIVDFLEGDPDRPIITGRVYNGANTVPYTLPDKKTISTIKSDSSIGGGGFNELRFEDAHGSEEVFLHSQKDLTITTLNDKNQSTGHDETAKIGNDRKIEVVANEERKVGSNQTVSIGSNRTVSVDGDKSESVKGARTRSVGKSETVSVAADQTLSVDGAQTISVSKDRTISVSKNENLSVNDNATISIGKDRSETIQGESSLKVGKNFNITVDKAIGAKADDSIVLSSDKDITLSCGKAKIILKKDGKISIEGGDITVKGSGNVALSGSKIAQN